jgi:hypothetical protein
VDTVVVGDVCNTIPSMLSGITNQRHEQVVQFTVHELCIPEHMIFQAPVVANIGGKISHFKLRNVHVVGVRSSVIRQVN